MVEKQELKRKLQILQVLSKSIRKLIIQENPEFEALQEIRLRIGQPLIMVSHNTEYVLPLDETQKHIVTKQEIRETMDYISNYSLYAFENEMKQGFITIEGGHRVGLTGKVNIENNRIRNMQYISSINIRIAHEVLGCADKVLPYITVNKQMCHTLVISPPRCGKTTLLRDLVRQISNGNQYVKGCTVGVVDERSELGGCYMGVAQNQMGMRTDILDCCPKAEGMIMLVRSMSPQVIAVDEIGSTDDIHAIEYAMHCGCKLLATVHGASMDEVKNKPILNQLILSKRFERYIVLDNQNRVGEIREIFDERGSHIYKDIA